MKKSTSRTPARSVASSARSFSGYSATAPNGAGCMNTPASTQPLFWNSTCDRVLNQIKPYKGYYAIDAFQTIFSANYNALQAKITYRGSGKSYIDANFSWSRDLTNDPGDSVFVQDIYNVNGGLRPRRLRPQAHHEHGWRL